MCHGFKNLRSHLSVKVSDRQLANLATLISRSPSRCRELKVKKQNKKRHKQTLKSPYLDRVSKVASWRDETVIFVVSQPVIRVRGAPAVANVLTLPPVSAAAFPPLFPLCPHTVQVSPRGNIPDSRHLDSHLEFSGCDTKDELTQTCAEDKRTAGGLRPSRLMRGKCRLHCAWEICILYVLRDLFVIAPLGIAVT